MCALVRTFERSYLLRQGGKSCELGKGGGDTFLLCVLFALAAFFVCFLGGCGVLGEVLVGRWNLEISYKVFLFEALYKKIGTLEVGDTAGRQDWGGGR